MKILITGGCGFIGSAVIRQAIDRGHDIVNVDCLTYAASLESVASVASSKAYHFERANIGDGPEMARIFKKHQPDTVMHLAAESHVDRSIDGPAKFMQTNVMGTLSLLEASRSYFEALPNQRKNTFRFHHVSTDEVYGDLSADDPAFCETTAYNPSSPYSASKAASDHIVRAWGRTYGLPVVISNCSNNYGPFQFPEKLIPVVLLKARARQPIPVYGTGDNIRDWLYVEDHARALLAVLEKGRLGETYNIGGNNERSNLDIVKTLCAMMDARVDDGFKHESLIRFVTDRPGHDQRYAINAQKIKSELAWEPEISGDAGLALTVEWYLKNTAWWEPLLAKKAAQRRGLQSQDLRPK